MKNLESKKIIITGAGSGIGRALSQILSSMGSQCALIDKDQDGLEKTFHSIKNSEKLRCYPLDITNRSQVSATSESIIKDFGEIDILINNAGVSSSGTVLDLSIETLQWTININLWGTIYMTKALLPHLVNRPESAVVNVSSVYGLIGIPGQSAYCASKFAVRGFTEALRQEFYGKNLKVITVFPGGIKTNIAKNSRSDYKLSQEVYQQKLAEFETTLKTSPDLAAQCIINGIIKNQARVLIGKDARQIDFLARFFPDTYDKTIIKSMKKIHK